MKEPLIDGLLRRTEIMNVDCRTKTGKSWFILQLAHSLVMGWDFLGFPCKKCKVLIMDNELHKATIASRMLWVGQKMNIPANCPELENLIVNTQRIKRHDVNEIARVAEQIREQEIDVVIIDALYRLCRRMLMKTVTVR